MEDMTPDLIQGTEPEVETVAPGAAEPEADPAETDPDAPPAEGETPEPEPPKPSGIEKRISELTYQRREAERREAEASRQAAYYRGIVEGKGGAQAAPPATDGPPKQESFDTYDEYLRALTRHEIRTEMAQERQKLTAEMEGRELRGTFESRVQAFREKHEDFDQVAFSDDHQVSPTMRDAILNSQEGAEIAYWLGKNPEESNRIARLSANHQIMELGRISARLAAPPPAPPPRPASAAPAPITPVRAKAVAVEGLRDDVSIGEWMNRRAKQLGKR